MQTIIVLIAILIIAAGVFAIKKQKAQKAEGKTVPPVATPVPVYVPYVPPVVEPMPVVAPTPEPAPVVEPLDPRWDLSRPLDRAPVATPSTVRPVDPVVVPSAPAAAPAQPTMSGDPGKGLWMPPGMPNRRVADQSGGADWKITYAPGCLNGLTAVNSSTGCAAQSSFNGFSLGAGRSLLLRYKSTPTAGSSTKYIRARSYDGGNVGVNMRVWLSTDPTATYAAVDPRCKQTSTRTPMVMSGPDHCPIAPDTVYYFGMEYDEPDALRFQVEEKGADFL